MSSIVPDLDTTTFEQLVERARGLIPRYAPTWTDHNLHDPGITLLDLLAWIVDQQVYRTGFLGNHYLEAFAALLDARRHGPSPARGLLWPRRSVDAERVVAAGALVACAADPDLPFQLETELRLSPARLTELVVDGGGSGEPLVVVHEADRTTPLSIAPSGHTSRATLVLRFDRSLVAASPAPLSIGFVVEPPPGSPPEPGEHRWGPLRLEHRHGDEAWASADLLDDGTAALARSGVMVFRVSGAATASPAPSELRLVLDSDLIPLERRITRVALNVLPVVQQAVEVAATFETPGTGLPDQSVPFDSTDLVDADSLEIRVGDEVWQQTPTLETAGPDDRVHVRGASEIVFGNGVNGRVPPIEAAIQRGPVTRTQGDRVLLRAGLVWNLAALGPAGSAFATNIAPIDGGLGPTDLADLLATARRSATERRALLTDDELAVAARLLPGFAVARAEVITGFHPYVPDRRTDGTRTLVVIPHRRRQDPAMPARPAYLAAVRSQLADRRVLGERLVVAGHVIAAVAVDLSVRSDRGVPAEQVRARIADRLLARFTDVASDDTVAPWPLGRTVTCEEVAWLAVGCDGVLAVESCAIGRAGEPRSKEAIALDPDEVAVLVENNLRLEVVSS